MKHKTDACGCCEGIEKLTPLATANRPGLTQLSYRVGTHATFLETMLARLSNLCFGSEEECGKGNGRPLQGLKTRERNDPSIALLDAWATVANVLTFYQERIANEGFLRTATERRSVLELARLVGYKLRPGVSSSVFLAYTLDENFKDEVVIPKGARAQSLPGPGELPQSYETSEDLKARTQWNNLKPRMTRPQKKNSTLGDGSQHVYLKGISTNLKPNDPLLIDFGDEKPKFYRVREVSSDPAAYRTLVILQMPADNIETISVTSKTKMGFDVGLINALTLRPSVQPPNSLRLSRGLKGQFSPKAETGYTVVSALYSSLREKLVKAASNALVTKENPIKVYALRVKASLFGHNAPREPEYETVMSGSGEFQTPIGIRPKEQPWDEWKIASDEGKKVLYLNNRYNEILPESHIAIVEGGKNTRVFYTAQIEFLSRHAYGISGDTTKITLSDEWWTADQEKTITELRDTSVYAQSEQLELAEEPIEAPVCGGADERIELDGFYEGLESGRWLVVSGERDIANTSGVKFSEVAMIASVEHKYNEQLHGDRIHTFIKLAENLQYCFKRDTVTIYGNVVKATHGETRKEVLGSGDGAKALQSFFLKQPPLTFVSAPNPSGVDSTLKVYVNDVQWHEADSLARLSPTDRAFINKTDDEGKTAVIFGNGRQGTRLPTGMENIKAEYRNGIGKPGNVKAGQITLLATRPLGVKEVLNPLRASGGADKENRDQARKNTPLTVTALDRLVSVQDYEDFAHTYAGIGKARATEISDGMRQVVHVTIAGAEDIPIDESSDLFQNLYQALHDYGDPFQPVKLAVRELMFIVISAGVRIMPDYEWEPVVTQVRSALLDVFGFERRELGQDILLSEVISIMQGVRGVAYVDVDVLRGIPEKMLDPDGADKRRLLTPDEISGQVIDPLKDENGNTLKEPLSRIRVNLADYEDGIIRPAQIAFLTPDVPATLILNQIT